MEVDDMIDNAEEAPIIKAEEKPDTSKHSVEDYRRLYKFLLSKYTAKLDKLKELAAKEKSMRNVVKYQTARNNALVDIIDYVSESQPVDEKAKLQAIIAQRPELAHTANAILDIDSKDELPELPQNMKDRLYMVELVDPVKDLRPVSEEVHMDESANILRRENNELVEAQNILLSYTPEEILKMVDLTEPQDGFPFTSTKILRESNPEMFHLDHEEHSEMMASSLMAWKKAASIDPNPKKKKREEEAVESSKRPKIIKFPVS